MIATYPSSDSNGAAVLKNLVVVSKLPKVVVVVTPIVL